MSKQMTIAIAGLGSRGRDTYAKAATIYPDKMKIVAIADIDPEKVKLTARNMTYQNLAAIQVPKTC